MTPLPEQTIPPQLSMGCVLSHSEDHLEPPAVPTAAPEHQLNQTTPQPQLRSQPQQLTQYQTITLQDLQQPEPQTYLPDPQTPPAMLPILSNRIRPARTSPEDIKRGRSRNTRHTCNYCIDLSNFPICPVRCPYTGEPLVTEQELERRWRQQVLAREMAGRRRPLGHDPRYGGVPMRNGGVGGRRGGYGAVGGRGGDEEWEDGDGAPDVIEGGFSHCESPLRQLSGERKKVEGWIQRCIRARCVGFMGEAHGEVNRVVLGRGDDGERDGEGTRSSVKEGGAESENEELVVYHQAVAQWGHEER